MENGRRSRCGLRPKPNGFLADKMAGVEQDQLAFRPEAETQFPAGAHHQQGPGGHAAGVLGIAPVIPVRKFPDPVRQGLGGYVVPPAPFGGQQGHVDGIPLHETVHHRLG